MQTNPHRKFVASVMGTLVACFALMHIALAQKSNVAPETEFANGEFRLTATESELSVEANKASVAEIFAEIGRQTGIPITLYPGADEIITIRIDGVPLSDAFKLITKSVTIVTAEEPHAPPLRIAKVYVFGPGQSDTHYAVGAEMMPHATESEPKPFEFTFDPSQYEDTSE